MNRNFSHLNIYLNRLLNDVYEQPTDKHHTALAMNIFNKWFRRNAGVHSVLDVGCGDDAFMKEPFESMGVKYTGVALRATNPDVLNMDFSFLEFEDETFDLVWARHSLEHSPMPLLSLMEWARVSKAWLCVILPNPEQYQWAALNHYSMMNPFQIEFLLARAGWHIVWTDFSEKSELRYMCEKVRKSLYEQSKEENK